MEKESISEEVRYEYNEISFANGNLYRGELKVINNNEAIMHGKGYLLFGNGDIYIGDFKEDKCEGFGMRVFNETQCRYIGQYFNDKMDGIGVFRFKSGNEYRGEFKEDNYWEKW